jgi:hypothetical protein
LKQASAKVRRIQTEHLADVVKGKYPIAARGQDPFFRIVEEPLVFPILGEQIVPEASHRVIQDR